MQQHEQLLFASAYPRTQKEWVEARKERERTGQELEEMLRKGNGNAIHSAMLAGFRGSVITASFSYALTRWLVNRFPEDTELDSSGADPESVRVFFRSLLPRTEYELISTGELSLLKRIQQLKGSSPSSALSWLLSILEQSNFTGRVKETLYHNLQVFVRWKINDPFFNRGWPGLSPEKPFFHRTLNRKVSLSAILEKKLPPPERINPVQKKLWADMARCSLAFLLRETEPFTYADPAALVQFRLERGLDVTLYSMEQDRRLSIESYIGYLACKNGIPVAYGGGWIFGKRCQFGINILPAFRGGESAWLFAQLARVYRQFYGIQQLVIKPYQFGKNNPEAIRTGAFWFYYKLGFRSTDTELQSLAEQEWKPKKRLHITVVRRYC